MNNQELARRVASLGLPTNRRSATGLSATDYILPDGSGICVSTNPGNWTDRVSVSALVPDWTGQYWAGRSRHCQAARVLDAIRTGQPEEEVHRLSGRLT